MCRNREKMFSVVIDWLESFPLQWFNTSNFVLHYLSRNRTSHNTYYINKINKSHPLMTERFCTNWSIFFPFTLYYFILSELKNLSLFLVFLPHETHKITKKKPISHHFSFIAYNLFDFSLISLHVVIFSGRFPNVKSFSWIVFFVGRPTTPTERLKDEGKFFCAVFFGSTLQFHFPRKKLTLFCVSYLRNNW